MMTYFANPIFTIHLFFVQVSLIQMQEKLEKEKSQAEVKSTSTHEEPSKYLYRELPIRNAYKASYSSIRGVTFFGDQFNVYLNNFLAISLLYV